MFKRSEWVILTVALVVGVLNFFLLGAAPVFYLALAGIIIPPLIAIRRKYERRNAHDDSAHS
jgi:hypothetical protein